MTSKRSEAIMKKNMKKNEINSQTQVQQEKLQYGGRKQAKNKFAFFS